MKNNNKFRWIDIPADYITYIQFNDKLKYIMDNNFKRIEFSYGSNYLKVINTYSIIRSENKTEIRVCYDYKDVHRYIVYHSLYEVDPQEKNAISGQEAFNNINDKFVQIYNKSIITAFESLKHRDLYKQIKGNVPKQIAYIHPRKGVIYDNCFKADTSSAYPYELTKDLPTLKDCKILNGKSEPDEEYKFAFYLKSHHIKIYNELDTKVMNNKYYPYYSEVYDDKILDEDEITVLCKTSEYSFKSIFEELYKHRKDNPENKLYMNAFIGFCHRNNDPRLSFLAAVAIARNNYIMLNRINTLKSEGNLILYVATDSIVWRGKYSNIASENKALGVFTYEGKNGKFFGRAVGAYQFLDDECNLTTKCFYLRNSNDKYKIEFGKLPEPINAVFVRDKNGFIINILGDDDYYE